MNSLQQLNSDLTSEVASLKSTLNKLERRYQQLKQNAETATQESDVLAQLRQENAQLSHQLQLAKESAESIIGEKSALLSDLEAELASAQKALESVQTEMTVSSSSKTTGTPGEASIRNTEDIALIDELSTELQVFKAQLEESTRSDTSAREHIAELESAVTSSNMEKDQTTAQLAKVMSQVSKEKATATELLEQLHAKSQVVQDLESELNTIISSQTDQLAQISVLKSKVEEQEKEMKRLQLETSSALDSDRQHFQNELESLKSENAELLASCQSSEMRVAQLESEKMEREQALQKLRVDLVKSEAEYSSISYELHHMRRELNAAREAVATSAASAQEAVAAASSKVEDSETVATLKAELAKKDEILFEAYAAFETEMAYMAKELEENLRQQVGVSNSSSSSEAETALELKKAIESLEIQLKQAKEEASPQQDLEKKANIELKTRFLSELDVLRNENTSLQQQILILKEESDMAQKDLEGEVVSLTSALNTKSLQMESLAAQIHSLQSELAMYAKSVPSVDVVAQPEGELALQLENASLKEQMDNLSRIAQEAESSLDRYASRADELESQVDTLSQSLKELETQKALALAQVSSLQQTNQELTSTNDHLRAIYTDLEAKQEKTGEHVTQLSEASTAQLTQLNGRLQEAELEISTWRTKCEEAETKKSELNNQVMEKETHLSQLQQALDESMQFAKDLEGELTGAQETLQSARYELEEVQEERNKLQHENSRLTDTLASNELRLSEKDSLIETIQNERLSAKEEVEELRSELDQLSKASLPPPSTDNGMTPSTSSERIKTAPVSIADDWGNDDDWGASSPVEQQAELEYLRTFLKTKTQEIDSLKSQLAVAAKVAASTTTSVSKPQDHSIQPSSIPSSPYIAPVRTSSPSLAPIHIQSAESKDVFGEDNGWDDMEFEPIVVASVQAPVEVENSDSLKEEMVTMRAELEALKAVERQNVSLKSALDLRDTELSEGADEYRALESTCKELRARIRSLESQLEAERREAVAAAEANAQSAPLALPSPQISESSKLETQNVLALRAELDKANTTIRSLQTLLASKPSTSLRLASSSSGPSKVDRHETEEGDGWGSFEDEEEESDGAAHVRALETEVETLRHLGEQKDADLSRLRVDIAGLKSKISNLEAIAMREAHNGGNEGSATAAESEVDVAERLTQAVEEERFKWQDEVAKMEVEHAKQIEALELKHLTTMELFEQSTQEASSQVNLDTAILAAKIDAEREMQRRLQDVEEVHTARKELLESQFAALSSDHQSLQTDLHHVKDELSSVTQQNKVLSTTVSQLESDIASARSVAVQFESMKEENTKLRNQCETLRNSQLGSNVELVAQLDEARAERETVEASVEAVKESYQLQLEEAKQTQLEAETRYTSAQIRLKEMQNTLEALRADLRSKQDALAQRDIQFVDLQARMNSDKKSREHTLLTAEEDVLSLREENARLKTQVDQAKKSAHALNAKQLEMELVSEEAKRREEQSAMQVKLYAQRLEQLQALVEKPSSASHAVSEWAEQQLVTQAAIAERLTNENAKLSRGLVSGLIDQQTPVERLAAAKSQLQERVDRLEKDLKRMRSELTARTEERDTLRKKVDTLTSERTDLKRQLSSSPSTRYHSPAAHFASYSSSSLPLGSTSGTAIAATPGSPYTIPAQPQFGAAHQNGGSALSLITPTTSTTTIQ